MDLSIITVPWNVRGLVRENFTAIFKTSPYPSPSKGEGKLSFEVISVDNSSQDGTTEMIRNEFPEVKAIFNNYNAGFAKANNQGIKEAKGRYVLLLNPDMRVLPDTLEKIVKWMDEHPEAGVAGCNLINEKGETVHHVRRFPTIWDQLAIILKIPHVFPSVLNKYLAKDFDYTREAEVNSIRGSFFMIRRELIEKIGGLDERYFVWFEEVDYCKQVKKAGYKVMYTPIAQCIDHVGKSFSQVKRGKTQDYFRDSMLKYFKKWHPSWQVFILKTAWPIGQFLAWFGDKINYQTAREKVN